MQHHPPAILIVSTVLATVISAFDKRRGGHVVSRPCKKIFEEYEQLDCNSRHLDNSAFPHFLGFNQINLMEHITPSCIHFQK